jgi:hypothetical protein
MNESDGNHPSEVEYLRALIDRERGRAAALQVAGLLLAAAAYAALIVWGADVGPWMTASAVIWFVPAGIVWLTRKATSPFQGRRLLATIYLMRLEARWVQTPDGAPGWERFQYRSGAVGCEVGMGKVFHRLLFLAAVVASILLAIFFSGTLEPELAGTGTVAALFMALISLWLVLDRDPDYSTRREASPLVLREPAGDLAGHRPEPQARHR